MGGLQFMDFLISGTTDWDGMERVALMCVPFEYSY